MSNPYEPNSAAWAAREAEMAKKSGNTSSMEGQKVLNHIANQKRASGGGTGSSENPTGCFPAGTLVKTPNGDRVIESLRAGDEVLTWDIARGRWQTGRVLLRRNFPPRRIVEIVREGDKRCQTTLGHSFLTQRGWVIAKKLLPGDVMMTGELSARTQAAVVAVESTTHEVPVYSLVTTPNNNFVAGELIAHNFSHVRGIQKLVWPAVAVAIDIAARFRSEKRRPEDSAHQVAV